MSKDDKSALGVSLQHKHTTALSNIDRMHEALNNLNYEGKVHFQRNLKTVGGVIEFLKTDLLPHIQCDEDVIFPFLEKHVPKLVPMLGFLKGEHREMKENLKKFEGLFLKLQKEEAEDQRMKIVEKLRDSGIYLFCL